MLGGLPTAQDAGKAFLTGNEPVGRRHCLRVAILLLVFLLESVLQILYEPLKLAREHHIVVIQKAIVLNMYNGSN